MTPSTSQINEQLDRVEEQIKALGPVLIGCIKKNRCKKTRKDGSIYISKNVYHTFVYKNEKNKECWKRINAKALPAIQRMKKNGDAYQKLAKQHERLSVLLALATLGEKKNDSSRNPGSKTSAMS